MVALARSAFSDWRGEAASGAWLTRISDGDRKDIAGFPQLPSSSASC
jgi:hypothetical protein